MKKSIYSLPTIGLITSIMVISCENDSKITLVSPTDKATGQNVITARLTWISECDSFDVFLGSGDNSKEIPMVATIGSNVFNSDRLDFNTAYSWKVKGYKRGKNTFSSPVWNFTTRDHSNASGLSSEYGNIRNGIGYFQDPNGTDVKAVDLDSFEELWTYKFEDMYDVSPMIERTNDGTWLIIEHERANGRINARYLADGEEAWISDNNIPYIGGTGFNYYINKEGLTEVLAKGSNGLHALSIEDGSELWFTPAQSWFSTIPAVDQKNRWIYSQSFERVDKINAETGKVIRSKFTKPEAMTTHSNTLLVYDEFGYYIATANWNGNVLNGDVAVYDSSLNVVWKKDRLLERLSSICYHDGMLFSAQCGGWYLSQNKLTDKYDWKNITAFDIRNGDIKWNLSLAKYKYDNIEDVVYCNNYLYAITDNIGSQIKSNRLLFKIRASDGLLEEVLDFGFPRSICASPVISDGKLFEAGIPTLLGEGEKCDWYGQYGVRQLNHNAANDRSVIHFSKMKNLQFNPTK
jgi:hypothetical protein